MLSGSGRSGFDGSIHIDSVLSICYAYGVSLRTFEQILALEKNCYPILKAKWKKQGKSSDSSDSE
jgi:hypothetical protein